MERKHNERNAQLMAKCGASAELMSTVLDLSIDECRRIRETNTTRLLKSDTGMHRGRLEEAIATAIKNAQQMYEDSYLRAGRHGSYTIDDEACFMTTCEQQSLPPRLWYVLSLANHWSNDLADWATSFEDDNYLPGCEVEPSAPEMRQA